MPELSGHLLYFAYGDDLSRAAFEKACPGAEWFGPARMEGHRLAFAANGSATVRAASAADEVWGVLWMVPAARLALLDKLAVAGFARSTRRIVSPAGPRTEAMVYVGGAADVSPPEARLRALREAAKESRLPPAYLSLLKGLGEPAKAAKDSR